MAALLAVACAGANPKSQRMARVGTAEDAKELETLPTIRLALDVRGGSIGLVGAGNGPMCDGPITGSLIIRAPGGGAERISVQVAKLSARVCVSCDPVQGNPRSCDEACRSEYLPWIEVGHHAFANRGDYAISGEELRLGCAPDRFRVDPAYVAVDGNGVTQRIPALRTAVPTPAPNAPPATAPADGARETASEIRLRFPRPSSPLTGETEGLALPVGPQQPEGGVSATRWGLLRSPQPGTSVRFITSALGLYSVFIRPTGGGAPVPMESDGRAHIVSVTAEKETEEARRAEQNGGVVVSAWRQLDGAEAAREPRRALALDVGAALGDATVRWQAFAESQREAVAQALAAAEKATPSRPSGRARVQIESHVAPTWMPERQRLLVRFATRTTRSSAEKVRETVCPRNRPGDCRTVPVPDVRAVHADLALELEYDRSGLLVAERRYPANPVPTP